MKSIKYVAITFIVSIALTSAAAAQVNSAITPVVSVSPGIFPAGQQSSLFVTVTNGNPSSTTSIIAGDSFSFTFGPASGSGVTLESPPMVNSSSLNTGDFVVLLSAANQVTIVYQGAAKLFRPGESFSVKLMMTAPVSTGSGRIIAQGPAAKGGGRYNDTTPAISTIAFVDFATGPKGVKGDTGLQGPKGDTGLQGAKGDKGDTGLQGPKGDKGDTGLQGLTGAKGDKGDAGAQGPQGPGGVRGFRAFAEDSATFVVPDGVTIIEAEIWGGGGGGGNSGSSNNIGAGNAGGGGGAGGYTRGFIAVTPGQMLQVVVGAAGAGGIVVSHLPPIFGPGSNGGDSYIADSTGAVLLSAGGGKLGGQGQNGGGSPGAGGAGGEGYPSSTAYLNGAIGAAGSSSGGGAGGQAFLSRARGGTGAGPCPGQACILSSNLGSGGSPGFILISY